MAYVWSFLSFQSASLGKDWLCLLYMVRLINCRLQFPSLLQAEQAWSSQPLLLHAVPQPPDQPGAPLSNWDWAPNSALLGTFQPGGNLSCPLVPAALHKPHVVVSHSISLLLIIWLICHTAAPERGRTFSPAADVVFSSVAAASLFV